MWKKVVENALEDIEREVVDWWKIIFRAGARIEERWEACDRKIAEVIEGMVLYSMKQLQQRKRPPWGGHLTLRWKWGDDDEDEEEEERRKKKKTGFRGYKADRGSLRLYHGL